LNTSIPACLWFLTRDKTAHGRDRRGEVLFIDARKLGRMESKVHRIFSDADVAKIADTAHRWRQDGEATGEYINVAAFCQSVKIEEIRERGYVLTPSRYVAAEAIEDDDETFVEKMERLTALLAEQTAKGAELDSLIREKLGALGYAL
jgi:type I restriction enzyme M protein